ncbi:hypothetical protein, partial [Burkholderia ubonensis]|uniref:hypothetical protein n=1 Tax=Burkholderia ubonensis TaxID=101571 RepID=UPI001C4353D0
GRRSGSFFLYGRRAALRQESPDKEAVLATGRGCKHHELRETVIEFAAPAIQFMNFSRRPEWPIRETCSRLCEGVSGVGRL